MDAARTFVSSTLYNIALQLSYKIFTFLLNAYVLRALGTETLGIANVRMMLLYTTLCFIVREPFRRACLQPAEELITDNKKAKTLSDWKRTTNLMWLCPVICLPSAVLLGCIWIFALSQSDTVPFYSYSVFAYSSSVFIESLAEPFWIIGQQFKFIKLKATIESVQIFSRIIVIFSLTFFFPHWNLVIFSFAMVSSSLLYSFAYFWYFYNYKDYAPLKPSSPGKELMQSSVKIPFHSIHDILPNFGAGFDWETFHLIKHFGTNSILKQLLTEGERYVMTVFDALNFSDQGIYDVIHNLGSLIARIIFLPLEESAFVFFSTNIVRGRPAKQQESENFAIASKVLCVLLKVASLVGLIVCVFGYSYSFLALDLYGGSTLSRGIGPSLLRWYCFYVFLLALNGITECFLFSTMSQDQVKGYSWKLFAFFFVFVVLAVFWSKTFGAVGLLWANCINMGLRIVNSLRYISKYYKGFTSVGNFFPVGKLIPKLSIMFCLLVSLLFTVLANCIFCCGVVDNPTRIDCCEGVMNKGAFIGIGAVFLFITVMTIHGSETELMDLVEEFIIKPKLKKS